MKGVFLSLATVLASVTVVGQGQFLFDNYAFHDTMDARFRWGIEPPGFSIYGPNAHVEFRAGPEGTSFSLLQKLDITADFQTNALSLWGYVNPTVVTIPFLKVGARAIVLATVFGNALWSEQVELGPEIFFGVTLGGAGTPIPVAPLSTVIPFHFLACKDCQGDPPFLGFRRMGDGVLVWWSKGSLQMTDRLGAPWNFVTNWANPEIHPISHELATEFFRLKLAFPPESILGIQISFSIREGISPFGSSKDYTFTAISDHYGIWFPPPEWGSSSGTHTYVPTGDRTAVICLNDEVAGVITTELVFTNSKGGTFISRSDKGEATGAFAMECRSSSCASLGL